VKKEKKFNPKNVFKQRNTYDFIVVKESISFIKTMTYRQFGEVCDLKYNENTF